MSEPKLYKKFRVIRVSTGVEETDEFVCLRLSKEMNLDKLKEEILKIDRATTWKDIEVALLKSE